MYTIAYVREPVHTEGFQKFLVLFLMFLLID